MAVRVQILATEHWSLLATRSMTWGEVFSRAGIFLTVVSAAVVALALVAQATDFGDGFYVFALLVLPIVLVLGVGTLVRLGDALTEDVRLVFGMNRLRHAYLEIAPELGPTSSPATMTTRKASSRRRTGRPRPAEPLPVEHAGCRRTDRRSSPASSLASSLVADAA